MTLSLVHTSREETGSCEDELSAYERVALRVDGKGVDVQGGCCALCVRMSTISFE